MAHARFGPCPHCNAPLSYLEGVSGSTLNPECPRCHTVVSVMRATFLMVDHSRPPERPTHAVKPSS
jgi:phage FluMu protein Com